MPDKPKKPWVTPEVRKVELSEAEKRRLFFPDKKPDPKPTDVPSDEEEKH